jgi:hypothetical protein
MKLSEAILLGSTIMAAKGGRQYFSESEAGCALGMAAVAKGCRFRHVTRAVAKEESRTLGAEGVWGSWVLRVVKRPCECWWFRVPRDMRIKDIVAHLFDRHVVKKKNWTLDRLVAWVQTWEPEEINSTASGSGVRAHKAIPQKPYVYERQDEQEWQRARRAFEAQHRSGRSKSRVPWDPASR